jgi:hypothetical protein
MRTLYKCPAFSDKLDNYKLLKNAATYIQWNTQPLQVQLSLYVPPGVTYHNSKFCPHSVFVCFVWIWEQTAIISPYSVKWLVCITERRSVFTALCELNP